STHPLRGAIFETCVAGELLKERVHNGKDSNTFFWRDRSGREVGFILDTPQGSLPVEVKSGQSLGSDAFKGLAWWTERPDSSSRPGRVIYGGDPSYERSGAAVVGWRAVWSLRPPYGTQ
ncbi:MAG: putative AAA+ superfamily ATPase, partial [Rhodothermales bacterium]